MSDINFNQRPEPDSLLTDIAEYVTTYDSASDEAYQTALYCLMDALGCGVLALQNDECKKHVGPVVPGATFENGVPIPGTAHTLEPVHAAFNIGSLVRWLDYNDTWLAAEWGHPSDNLGAILSAAHYANEHLDKSYTLHDILLAMVKAYEIQGMMALENSFNRVGLDHVILVRIASTAVAAQLLGGSKAQIVNALSNAWIDGGALRTYRHAPNTGWRKSWAAGDATSRAVRHALMALQDEMGYPSALSAQQWGFYDVLFKGNAFKAPESYGCYVMENVLFKVAFPVEFHAQTAVECAFELHPNFMNRIDKIDHIELRTQEAAMRIINKTGPLHNPADRDHSLQYAVAIGLLYGHLEPVHYSDDVADDLRIDQLRDLMRVEEDKRYSQEYLDPDKRSIANAVTIYFKDETSIHAEVEYPIGHRKRRNEAYPLLKDKLKHNLSEHFPAAQAMKLIELLNNQQSTESIAVDDFMNMWATP